MTINQIKKKTKKHFNNYNKNSDSDDEIINSFY